MAEMTSGARASRSAFWAAFTRPRTFLPQEHGGWILLLGPMAIGAVVGSAWSAAGAAFAVAALALFLSRQPLDLALKSMRGKRTRADLPALAAWLAIDAAVGLAAGVYLLATTRLWGLLIIGAAAAALMALQLWALQTRLHRKAWVEVAGTGALGLAGAGIYYVGRGAWAPEALALWLLPSLQGIGGVLYSRWRLRRRRLAAQGKAQDTVSRRAPLAALGLALAVAIALAALGWAPWTVVPLFAILLGRVAWGSRPSAAPDRSAMAIGIGEGIATLGSAAWIALAFLL